MRGRYIILTFPQLENYINYKEKKDGMIILENLVLHTQNMVMQHGKHKILYWTGCP